MSTESTFVTSKAVKIFSLESMPLLCALLIHLTVCPFPLDLFCFFQLAGYTRINSGDGESDRNASVMVDGAIDPFSLFLDV